MSESKEREVREELIVKLKSALENHEQGDLFMDEDGDVYDNIDDATGHAEPGEVVKLVRFIQLPEAFVAVNEDNISVHGTLEEAEEALEDEED